MKATQTNTSKSAKSTLTPRIKTGKTLLRSAQGDLTSAQRKLDTAQAIRRFARRSAA
jgi:hypothetical protein